MEICLLLASKLFRIHKGPAWSVTNSHTTTTTTSSTLLIFCTRNQKKRIKVLGHLVLKIWCQCQAKWGLAYAIRAQIHSPLINEIPSYAVCVPLFPRHSDTRNTESVTGECQLSQLCSCLFPTGMWPAEKLLPVLYKSIQPAVYCWGRSSWNSKRTHASQLLLLLVCDPITDSLAQEIVFLMLP